MRALCVVGARPNFVKIKPVMQALEGRGVDVVLVHTGQHYDRSMSAVFFDELEIRPPDHFLDVGSGSHAAQTAAVMVGMDRVLREAKPDVVVVVGDVNSTLAAALCAAKSPARLAHVEAGLRSRDWTMPEEINRIATDAVSDDLFAPSPDAVENLLHEGHEPGRVHLVGNVMVDTLFASLERANRLGALERHGLESGTYGLITLHRPSNVDDAGTLDELIQALAKVADRCPLLLPAHPRTAQRLATLTVPDTIRVTEPLGYLEFVALEAHARVVLTDSGGVQEETTALGIPCLTMRDTTERPITISEGTNVLVGRDPDRILEAAEAALAGEVPARRPALWDGHAADRIAGVLTDADRPRR